ncbi:MAG: hypothetical protein ACKV2O_04450 [Acidimicrobiales bacterium]
MEGLIRGRDLPAAERRRLLRAGVLRRVARGVYEVRTESADGVDGAGLADDAVLTGRAYPRHQAQSAGSGRGSGYRGDLAAELARDFEIWCQDLARRLVQWGPGVVVARSSAAALWCLDGFEPPVPITVNTDPRSGLRHAGVRRVTPIEPFETIAGFPVTGIGQTLIELGAGLAARPGARNDPTKLTADELVELAVESALREALTTEADLLDLLARVDGRRRGAAVLQRVLERRPYGAPATESYLETRGVQVLRRAGVGPGCRQVEVRDRRGRYIKRVDLVLADRVIVEFDGNAFHDPEIDHDLWTAFVAAGYQFVPAGFAKVTRHPSKLVAQIRDALEAADLGEANRP